MLAYFESLHMSMSHRCNSSLGRDLDRDPSSNGRRYTMFRAAQRAQLERLKHAG